MANPYDPKAGAYRFYQVEQATGGPAIATNPITPVITTHSPAYSANDVIGGVLTLTGAVRSAGGAGLLQSLMVVDRANQKAPLTILLFDSTPAGTYADNVVCPSIGADAAKLIRKINVAASDYETIGGIAVADIAAISKAVKASGSADLKAVVVTTGTPTFTDASTTDLSIRFGFLPD